jgi:hypothetical protein
MKTNVICCCLCSAETNTIDDLDNHILTDHPDIFRSVPDSQCDIKMQKFPEKIEEKKKLEEDDRDRQVKKIVEKSALVILYGVKCLTCNFIATDRDLLNSHMIEKHLRTSSQMVKHPTRIESSSDPIKRKCPGCEKTFGTLPRLERHYLIFHSAEGNTCDLCGKSFYDGHSRKRHFKNVHCEREIMQCPNCQKTFKTPESLKIHLNNVHRYTSPKLVLQCELCNESFADSKSRKKHYLSVHDGKRCKCLECGKLCKSVWHLKSHLQSMHNKEGNRLPCLYCEKSFLNFYSLGKHYKDIHGGKKIISSTLLEVH